MSAAIERISKIYFGKVDAKNEIIGTSAEKKEYFYDSFVMPPSVNMEKLVSGEAFFITGMKGAGKTALIRKLDAILQAEKNVTDVILFRRVMAEGAAPSSVFRNLSVVEQNEGDDYIDFEIPLFWFMHRQLALLIREKLPDYISWRGVKDYLSAVSAFAGDARDKGLFRKLFPTIKDGNLKVSIKAVEAVSAEIGVNFEYDEEGNAPLQSVVSTMNGMVSHLADLNSPIRLLFDELELSLSSEKQFRRDAQLIRDFVIVTGRMNELFDEAGVNIRIFGAIRSEVLLSAFATGKEMYKLLEDRAVNVNWYHGEDLALDPLLSIVPSKINATEKMVGVQQTQDVWYSYFGDMVFNKPIKRFIMDMTWSRPRDIVRLMETAQEADPTENKFTHSSFKRGAKAYSRKCWADICEELQASYNQHEINAIKDIFFSFRRHITMPAFEARIEMRKTLDHVKRLAAKKSPRAIVVDMYRLGVVGNTEDRDERDNIISPERWVFRGFPDVDDGKDIIVHPALWEVFELV